MKCIICGKEKDESKEHIIPEALGNKQLTTNRVCQSCNEHLGSNVDYYLTDHPLVKLIRIKAGLAGKKNKKIKLLDGRERDVNTGNLYDLNSGVPKIVPRLLSDEKGHIVVEASSFTDALVYFKKKLSRKGYSKEKIDELCKGARLIGQNNSAPEFKKDASINFALMDLSAIKIAYEYAYLYLGEEYLQDPIAVLFRRELYKAVQSEKNDVSPADELAQYVVFPLFGSGLEKLLSEQREMFKESNLPIRHTVFIIRQDNSLYCILNLCMEDIISFAIKITETADLYNIINLPYCFVYKDGSIITI